MSDTVLLSIEKDTAYCCFNRPQAMNTYNDVMSDDLLMALKEINRNEQVRFVVLKGVNHLFMAGGDISFFEKNLETMPKGIDVIIDKLSETINLLQSMNKITIAFVEGACAGVGISFMLSCDLAIAADNAKFNTGYSSLGLSPDGGMSYLLPRHVGLKKSFELLLMAESFSANKAHEMRLVNFICDKSALNQSLEAMISSLRTRSSEALVACKKLLNDSLNQPLEAQLALEKKSFIALSQTSSFKRNVKKFMSLKT